jgi:hypothetical protein
MLGPGTGKSTTATALFSELKQLGINCEYVPEYAKDATWERRGAKVFAAQEYLFAKQHFRMSRVAEEVDIMITDSPILLTLAYMPKNFGMPSLVQTVKEAYALYDNLDVFLERNKPYNPKGRNQTLEESIELDGVISKLMHDSSKYPLVLPYGRAAITKTIREAARRWGKEIPELHDFIPNFQPVLTSKQLPPIDTYILTANGKIVIYNGAKWFSGMTICYEPEWWMPIITDADVFQ